MAKIDRRDIIIVLNFYYYELENRGKIPHKRVRIFELP